jgi:hypothetical protein
MSQARAKSCIGWIILGLLVSAAQAEMVTRRWGTPGKAEKAPARPPSAYVAETTVAPRMDGQLGDEVWAKATVLRMPRTLDGAGPAARG